MYDIILVGAKRCLIRPSGPLFGLEELWHRVVIFLKGLQRDVLRLFSRAMMLESRSQLLASVYVGIVSEGGKELRGVRKLKRGGQQK